MVLPWLRGRGLDRGGGGGARAQRPEGNHSLPVFRRSRRHVLEPRAHTRYPEPLEGYVRTKRRSGGRHAHRALRRRNRAAVANLVRDRLSLELPRRSSRRVALCLGIGTGSLAARLRFPRPAAWAGATTDLLDPVDWGGCWLAGTAGRLRALQRSH